MLGVLAAHGLALLVTWHRTEVLNPISQSQVVERMVVAYRVASSSSVGDDFHTMLWTVGTEDARFWIEDVDSRPLQPMSEQELRIAQSVATYLPEVPFDQIAVHLTDSGETRESSREGWRLVDLNIAMPLPNGQWLYSYQQPLAGYQWLQLLRFSLPVSTLPILALVLLFIYWVVRPLKTLARAAERVSRGERLDMLAVEGAQETRDLAVAFNTMQTTLMDYVQGRTQMLAAISHDIRTPITSLRLRVEMLPEGRSRDAMIRTLEDMQRMVEQTLRFARGDAVEENTEDLDLRVLLDGLVDDARRRLLGESVGPGRSRETSSIRLDAPETAPYRGRPLALQRALQNLLDNALRFGRQVSLQLRQQASASGQSGWLVTVDDDGPGIPAELMDKVFEPFFQVDAARSQGAGGVGLGLSIARSAVQGHGGVLSLHERDGGGLRARVWLPT